MNSGHLTVFVYHLLNNVINLLFLLLVLLVSFVFKSHTVGDLFLEEILHAHAVFGFPGLFIPCDLVLDFLCPEHDLVNVGVLLLDK